MNYFFLSLVSGAATYYVTELLTFFWAAPRIVKVVFDAAINAAAIILLFPLVPIVVVPYLAANCFSSVLRIAVDAVVSKPAVIRRR